MINEGVGLGQKRRVDGKAVQGGHVTTNRDICLKGPILSS